MGHFVEGRWVEDDWSRIMRKKGAFVRPKTALHGWIGGDGESGFKAERAAIICTSPSPARGRTAR